MKKQNINLVIHGHFYQPPRENPWIYTIERQESAYPYHNWNERINEECFSANTDSRVLDKYGHIKDIINNYQYISFNIGPTLFKWIEKEDRNTYQKIIDADKRSVDMNNGHGNAIATAFNHTILPLSNDEDLQTQVKWGLDEFEYRFGRKSKSIWLPETAVNHHVVDELARQGVKFIILSPTQAQKVRKVNTEEWIDISNNSIDIHQPYYIKTPHGNVAVFFYHGGLANAVSFDHLLLNSDKLRDAILGSIHPDRETQIVSYATDGEIYGHHEPFADMCLASMIYENRKKPRFNITNFANYLEMYPPQEEVMLKAGNEGLGTSWSCAHGVGRWMENCGCKTGGEESWTQEWRKPFREAMDILRNGIRPVFEDIGGAYLNDVWKARNDYIHHLLRRDEESLSSFLKSNAKKELSTDEVNEVLDLMECQKFAMYMYTSCAWFFTELSGIETVQNMKYAARALEFVEDKVEPGFVEQFKTKLKEAKSNIEQFKDGKWIYENFALSSKITKDEIIAQFVFCKTMNPDRPNSMYQYDINVQQMDKKDKDDGMVYSGIINTFNRIDRSKDHYIFYVIREDSFKMRCYLRRFYDDELKGYLDKIVSGGTISVIKNRFKDWFIGYVTFNDITFEYKEKLLNAIFEKPLSEYINLNIDSDMKERILYLINIVGHYHNFSVKIPRYYETIIENIFKKYLMKESAVFENDLEEFDYEMVEKLFKVAESEDLNIASFLIEDKFNKVLLKEISGLELSNLDADQLEHHIKLVDFANISQLSFKRKGAENKVYYLLEEYKAKVKSGESDILSKETAHNLIRLGSKLNINTEEIRSMVRIGDY
jgi:alpha-amylase/alpha-mannosidase (GH57 family)